MAKLLIMKKFINNQEPLSKRSDIENVKSELYKMKDALSAVLKNRNKEDNCAKLVKAEGHVNRCFIKLAEIDYLYQFAFTKNLNLFVDLCSGPGGFTEYLNSKSWKTFGYSVFHANTPLRLDKIGNLSAIESIQSDLLDPNAVEYLKTTFQNCHVDLVVADGAIDSKGEENEQEVINYPLIKNETDIALCILSTGGKLILKVFDMFTENMKQLLYVIWCTFHEMNVIKPSTSRKLNSEKYIVGIGFKGMYNIPSTSRRNYEIFEQFYTEVVIKMAKDQMDALSAECIDDHFHYLECVKMLELYKCNKITLPCRALSLQSIFLIAKEKLRNYKCIEYPQSMEICIGYLKGINVNGSVLISFKKLNDLKNKHCKEGKYLVNLEQLMVRCNLHIPTGTVLFGVFKLKDNVITNLDLMDMGCAYFDDYSSKPLKTRLSTLLTLMKLYCIPHRCIEKLLNVFAETTSSSQAMTSSSSSSSPSTFKINLLIDGSFSTRSQYMCIES